MNKIPHILNVYFRQTCKVMKFEPQYLDFGGRVIRAEDTGGRYDRRGNGGYAGEINGKTKNYNLEQLLDDLDKNGVLKEVRA